MTQREKVLSMLRSAGQRGVRSDAFLDAHLPRAAARVCELRQEGYEITSEHEKQFVRYRLVEETHSTGRERPGQTGYVSGGWDSGPSVGLLSEPIPLFQESTSAWTQPEAA